LRFLADSPARVRKPVHSSLGNLRGMPAARKPHPSSGYVPLELMKCFSKVLESPVETCFDGVDFTAEKLGNFAVLEFLKAGQNQDFALVLGKHHECLAQERGVLLLLRGVSRQDRRKHVGLELDLAPCLSEVIDAGIACNLVDPGAERRSGLIALAV